MPLRSREEIVPNSSLNCGWFALEGRNGARACQGSRSRQALVVKVGLCWIMQVLADFRIGLLNRLLASVSKCAREQLIGLLETLRVRDALFRELEDSLPPDEVLSRLEKGCAFVSCWTR